MPNAPNPCVIYIVDDDEGVLKAVARLMRACGFEAKGYQTPARFLQEIRDDVPACILLDITMPGMTGLQVQAALNQRGIAIPVIAISARDDDETRAQAHDLGMRTFLRKPMDDQALLDAIAWSLRSTQQRYAER